MADSLVFWTDADGDKDKLIREFVIGKGTALLKRWNQMEHLFPFWLFGALKLVLWHSSLIFAGLFKARTQDTIQSCDGIFYPRGGQPKSVSWAAFGKISKKIDFLGQILTKTVGKHSKYWKITEFQFKIGPQKFLSEPHAAHGPRVGHSCSTPKYCVKHSSFPELLVSIT